MFTSQKHTLSTNISMDVAVVVVLRGSNFINHQSFAYSFLHTFHPSNRSYSDDAFRPRLIFMNLINQHFLATILASCDMNSRKMFSRKFLC